MRRAFALILCFAGTSVSAAPVCISTAGLAVDADGAPDSYRVDGNGLSYTCDGAFALINGVPQTHKNNPAHWQDLCVNAWAKARSTGDYSHVRVVGFLMEGRRPVIQGKGDPLPGEAYVTTTSLKVPGTPNLSQRHFVNANEIPYVVGSGTFGSGAKVSLGDVIAVYRPTTHRVAFAVYGDCCTLGEGSVRLHQDLGNNPFVLKGGVKRAKAGIGDRVVFVAFPGIHTTPTLDAAKWRSEIEQNGKKALDAWGGQARLERCSSHG